MQCVWPCLYTLYPAFLQIYYVFKREWLHFINMVVRVFTKQKTIIVPNCNRDNALSNTFHWKMVPLSPLKRKGASAVLYLWVDFVVGFLSTARHFSPRSPVFPSSQSLKFKTPNWSGIADEEPVCGSTTSKSLLFIYFLIPFCICVFIYYF